ENTPVHALHTRRAGLVSRISCQPAISLAKALGHPVLEFDIGGPFQFLDVAGEPGRSFVDQLVHECAVGSFTAGFIDAKRLTVFGWEFAQVLLLQLEAPAEFIS